MSQSAAPTAGRPCTASESPHILEQVIKAEDLQDVLQPKEVANAEASCNKGSDRRDAALAPDNSPRSSHTGAARASPAQHRASPEERAAAVLLAIPPLFNSVPTPAGGTAVLPALAATAAADPHLAAAGSPNQRTNWATWPLGNDHQALLLTKFQVTSGQLSVPVGRATVVLGAFASNGPVSLHNPSSGVTFTADRKRYVSQPTQIFLVRLKAFFNAATARCGDVLSLAPGPQPGHCFAEIWHAEDPRAQEFKMHLRNSRPEGVVVGVAAASMAAKTAAVRAGGTTPAAGADAEHVAGGAAWHWRTSARSRLAHPPAPRTASASATSSAGWSSRSHTVGSEEGYATGGGGNGASSRLRKRGVGAPLTELSGPTAGRRGGPKRRAAAAGGGDPENEPVPGSGGDSPRKRGAAAARRAVRRGAAAQFRAPRPAAAEGAAAAPSQQPRASSRVLRSAAAEQEARRLRRKAAHPERAPEGEPDLEGYAAALMALGV